MKGPCRLPIPNIGILTLFSIQTVFAFDTQRKILNESNNLQQNQKLQFVFPLDISYFALMAGGTSAFNMIKSIRNNLSLKSPRRKMKDNPYLGPKRDINAQKIHLSEGIQHRIAQKDRANVSRLTLFVGLGLFLFVCLLALIVLL
jgi:hypothetical protein